MTRSDFGAVPASGNASATAREAPPDGGTAPRPRRLPPGTATALILLAFIVVPSVVLGLLSWRAIENEKSYSLERLRSTYRQVAGLAARQIDDRLHGSAAQWSAEFDELLGGSHGRPTPADASAFEGRLPLIEGYFLLGAPDRVLYPPKLTADAGSAEASAEAPGAPEHELFTRLVARGEALEYTAGNLAGAIAAYREASSHLQHPRLRAMALSYLGRAELKNGDYAGALATFRQLQERYPNVRDENRMVLRFLAQYQTAATLESMRRIPEALEALLALNRDLIGSSDAITTSQYAYYSELIQTLAPRLMDRPGVRDRARYERAFRTLGEQNKKRTSEKYLAHMLSSELDELTIRRKRFNPRTQYLSTRSEGDRFLVAYRALPDEQGRYVSGILACQIDLDELQKQLSLTLRNLHADSQAQVAILGSRGGVVIGPPGPPGVLMAAQDLSPPFDFWQVAIYLNDVPTAMKRLDLRRTLWLWLISLMLLCILFGAYVFILRARREAYLSRAQTNFVSNVTHELRAPLASISMFAELMELRMADAAQGNPDSMRKNTLQYLGIIRQECERLGRLIDRVLDFSRMERNAKQYRFEADDLGQVVSRVVESFRPRADARGFTLELSVDRPLPDLTFDADAISQVVLNLLNNALQYSDQEKDIRVRVGRQGAAVAIEITDHGIGIEPRDLDKVFDRFYSTWRRMDSPTQGGLGLGLTLSREIVRAHGGEIVVRSEVGRGSTFTVTLPAAECREPSGRVASMQASPGLGGQRP